MFPGQATLLALRDGREAFWESSATWQMVGCLSNSCEVRSSTEARFARSPILATGPLPRVCAVAAAKVAKCKPGLSFRIPDAPCQGCNDTSNPRNLRSCRSCWSHGSVRPQGSGTPGINSFSCARANLGLESRAAAEHKSLPVHLAVRCGGRLQIHSNSKSAKALAPNRRLCF